MNVFLTNVFRPMCSVMHWPSMNHSSNAFCQYVFQVNVSWTDLIKQMRCFESPHSHNKIFCINVSGKEGNTTNPSKFLPLHSAKDNENLVDVHFLLWKMHTFMSPLHPTALHHTMPHHATPCHTMPHHATPHTQHNTQGLKAPNNLNGGP